jgi:multicomponent K+:H+ antiporter subunit D
MAILGVGFAACALLLAGLPPLSGFIAKFLILAAMFQSAAHPGAITWTLLALLMVSGFVVMISLMRAGVRVFWVPVESTVPTVRLLELGPIVALLLLCAALTVQAGPAARFMQATAAGLYAPQTYIKDVLSAPRAQEGGS